jgi:hypothetical protein
MAADPSSNLPEIIVNEIEQCSNQQLEAIIRYAQLRLQERHGPTKEIEPRHDNETIVSLNKKKGYTIVIVEQAESQKQTAYHVTHALSPDSGEREYHWQYLGPVGQ